MNNYMIIDGKKVPYTDEKNILNVIRSAGIDMPTFCYQDDLSIYGACRMCCVEDERGKIMASCSERPRPNMTVSTNTLRLQKYRKTILELLLTNHNRDCTACEITNRCKLQEFALRYGIKKFRFDNNCENKKVDRSSPSIVRDPNKCIKCGDCVLVCDEVQGVEAIGFAHRGSESLVTPAFEKCLAESTCVNCGQCRVVCPTGAITIKNDTQVVWNNIFNKKKEVVAQIAPAVRVAIGEEFGYAAGTISVGKMVAALRKLGFDKIYDTAIAADLTVTEESREFLEKFTKGEGLPLFTSCCPAWVKFVENRYPEMLHNLSSARSPQQIFGSVYKSYMKENNDSDKETYLVSVMPCTAKKEEAGRTVFQQDGIPDVDVVITTQELATMIKEAGIVFSELEEDEFDLPFGIASGAGIIFGNTGGVMEAVLRDVGGDILDKLALNDLLEKVRGFDNVREATLDLGETNVKVAVVHGLKSADLLIKDIKEGKRKYDLIEVMTCKGGCIYGGGQPISTLRSKELRTARASGLYGIDRSKQMKRSKENHVMNELYEKFLNGKEHIMHIHR